MKKLLFIDDNIATHDPGDFESDDSEQGYAKGTQLGLMGYFVRELEDRNIAVTVASSVEASLSIIRKKSDPFDIVVLDIMMPYMDEGDYDETNTAGGLRTGFVLAREIRREYPNTPIWLLSQIAPGDSTKVNGATVADLKRERIIDHVEFKLGCDPYEFADKIAEFLESQQ